MLPKKNEKRWTSPPKSSETPNEETSFGRMRLVVVQHLTKTPHVGFFTLAHLYLSRGNPEQIALVCSNVASLDDTVAT